RRSRPRGSRARLLPRDERDERLARGWRIETVLRAEPRHERRGEVAPGDERLDDEQRQDRGRRQRRPRGDRRAAAARVAPPPPETRQHALELGLADGGGPRPRRGKVAGGGGHGRAAFQSPPDETAPRQIGAAGEAGGDGGEPAAR